MSAPRSDKTGKDLFRYPRVGYVRLGFNPHGVISFQLAPPTAKYSLDGKAPQLYRTVLDSLQSIPGVRGASVSSGIPFGAGNYTTHPMITTDQSILPRDAAVPIDWRIVSPGYFKNMGIPLLHGRDFTDADGPTAPPVMIISQATARKFWGEADPIGHTLRRSANPATAFTIVGVVGDVRSTALTQESPALYYPMAARVWPLMDIVVRADASPEALLPAIRQKVHELDAELALANVRTMEQWLSGSAAQTRLSTLLLTIFASIALVIASIGIYGVIAYSVSQRTGEIGVRMALGATPRDRLRLVVSEGMKVALIGIGAGLLGGLALGRSVSSLVFGMPVRDPWTFAGVPWCLRVSRWLRVRSLRYAPRESIPSWHCATNKSNHENKLEIDVCWSSRQVDEVRAILARFEPEYEYLDGHNERLPP